MEPRGDGHGEALTDDGLQFVKSAVEEWADSDWTPSVSDVGMRAGTYEATVLAQSISESIFGRIEATGFRKIRKQLLNSTEMMSSTSWI